MSSLLHLDQFIHDNSLLMHYFYRQKWNNGELTKEELALYAKEYFHLAKNVPSIVSRIKDRAIERGMTHMYEDIDENMREETEHIDLWKRFALSLDISEEELEAYEPHELTKQGVKELQALAEESFEDGVAAMYAMELALPEIAQSKKDGLCTYYGLTSEDAHIYFDEHLNEEEHFNVWRKVEVDAERASDVAKKSLAAQHKVLDGVCEVCGFCECA